MKVHKTEAKEAGAFLVIGTISAITSSWAVNTFLAGKAPVWRSLTQIGVGAVPLVFLGARNRFVRYAGMGSAFAGALGLSQNTLKLQTLAGNAHGTLSPAEIRTLQSMGALPQLNGPVTMRHLNGPATMHRMGAQQPSMMGGFKAPT